MIGFLRDNSQLLIILALWALVSYLAGVVALGVALIFIILFAKNELISDLFIGFLFILILSDNLTGTVDFAKSFKNIYLVFLFLFLMLKRTELFTFSRIHYYFLPFLLFSVIGIAYSPVPATAVQKTISYFLLVLVIPGYVIANYREYGPQFFKNLVFFILAVCIVGYLYRFVYPTVSISHGGRFRGLFGNPNGLGVFLIVFALLFSVVKDRFKGLFSRTEIIMIYVLILYFSFITGSRNSLISILLFFLFSYFFKISTILGFVGFMLAILSTEYVLNNYVNIINSFGLSKELRVETLQEGSGRLIAWEFAWKEIQRSLFIGRGMGYDEYYMRANAPILTDLGHEGGVHNTYLIIWLNAGLFGLLSFFTGFITLFIQGAKRDHNAFPVMFTVMFSINFEPWLAASLNPYTIICITIITLLREDIFFEKESTYSNEEQIA